MNKETYIFHLMNILKEESKCIDKQVVCIITDPHYNVLSYGVNKIWIVTKIVTIKKIEYA